MSPGTKSKCSSHKDTVGRIGPHPVNASGPYCYKGRQPLSYKIFWANLSELSKETKEHMREIHSYNTVDYRAEQSLLWNQKEMLVAFSRILFKNWF